jgi:hypothetical protein
MARDFSLARIEGDVNRVVRQVEKEWIVEVLFNEA